MNDETPDDALKILEQAEAAWRSLPVTRPAPEDLISRTVCRVSSPSWPRTSETRLRHGWNAPLRRHLAVAAAFFLMATVAAFWLLGGNGANRALASMLDQVRAAKTVRFTMSWSREGRLDSPLTKAFVVTMVDPDWLLVDFDTYRMRIDRVHHRQLVLRPHEKIAQVMDPAPDSDDTRLAIAVFDAIRALDPKDGKPLADQSLDGIPVKGFVVDQLVRQELLPMDLWVDAHNQRLVRVIVRSPTTRQRADGADDTRYLYFADFDWNPELDPAELSLTPPKGYLTLHNGPPTEADAVEMLRQFADLADGFPPALDRTTYRNALLKRFNHLKAAAATWPVNPGPEVRINPGSLRFAPGFDPATRPAPSIEDRLNNSEPMVDLRNQMRAIDLGFQFILNAEADADWHYAPATTKVGEKGKPVLWYLPPGKTACRVIDADFSVHDRPPSELPPAPPLKTDWEKAPETPGRFSIGTPPPSSMP
jgi:hypothetical protein